MLNPDARLNILLVNDDGFTQLNAELHRALLQWGHTVRYCLPMEDRSSCSMAVTSNREMKIWDSTEEALPGVYTDGQATDCTDIGLRLWPDTNLVLSGPNIGFNTIRFEDISGTVQAAKRATQLGHRAISISCCRFFENQVPGTGPLRSAATVMGQHIAALLPTMLTLVESGNFNMRNSLVHSFISVEHTRAVQYATRPMVTVNKAKGTAFYDWDKAWAGTHDLSDSVSQGHNTYSQL